MEWLLLLLAIVLTAGTAVFVAAEFGFVAVNRAAVEQEAEAGDKSSQRLLASLKSLSTQLSAAQVGITLTTLIVGYVAEPSIAQLLRGPLTSVGLPEGSVPGISIVAALVIATAVQMVFGELVPKNLAIARPAQTAKLVSPYMNGFIKVTGGFVKIFNSSANGILRLLHVEPQEELRSARSADEIGLLVKRSGEEGTLESETAKLINRTLEFGDRTAADVMTPRVRMQTISVSAPVLDVLRAVDERGHSRFPVIGDDRDDVVGIVHIKHAVAVPPELRDSTTVGQIMVEPVIVPGAAQLDPLLVTLRDQGLQMAVVVDEYGGTDGLVTLEDLVEELVGDIADEFDRPGSHARKRRDGSWSISGLLRPDEAAELTGITMPEDEDYDTLGGLVLDHLGRLPKAGDVVAEFATTEIDDHPHAVTLTVERMDGMRVDRIRLALVAQPVDANGAPATNEKDGSR